MLLPGGIVLDDRAAIVQSMSGQPWSSFELRDLRVIRPTADTAVITYAVVGQRQGALEYSALMSSLYVRRANGWKLTFRQQTPRGPPKRRPTPLDSLGEQGHAMDDVAHVVAQPDRTDAT